MEIKFRLNGKPVQTEVSEEDVYKRQGKDWNKA